MKLMLIEQSGSGEQVKSLGGEQAKDPLIWING